MLARFRRSESGNLSVMTALTSVVLLSAAGAALDVVSLRNKADTLQNALDSSALAIATKYYSGMTQDELQQIGQDVFASNAQFNESSEVPFEYTDAFDNFGAEVNKVEGYDYVTVTSQIAHDGLFLGNIDWSAKRKAVVKIMPGPPACVLALDKHASEAIKIQGSTQIDLAGCVIAANSDSASSVSRGGAAQLSAACVITVGGTSGVNSSSSVDLDCGDAREDQYASIDPLVDLVPPPYAGCSSMPGGKTKTLSPGTYCNKTISGDVTLEPGTYILRGGRINLGGNGSLAGEGVTIFLMEDAEFAINGNELVNLTPPSTGDYAGVTIYQEKSNDTSVVINGTADSVVTGFVYAPGAHVFYAGNSETETEGRCLRLVGDTIEMTGNSSIRSDCGGELGDLAIYAGRYMAIVR